jgi:hypothetical protein
MHGLGVLHLYAASTACSGARTQRSSRCIPSRRCRSTLARGRRRSAPIYSPAMAPPNPETAPARSGHARAGASARNRTTHDVAMRVSRGVGRAPPEVEYVGTGKGWGWPGAARVCARLPRNCIGAPSSGGRIIPGKSKHRQPMSHAGRLESAVSRANRYSWVLAGRSVRSNATPVSPRACWL